MKKVFILTISILLVFAVFGFTTQANAQTCSDPQACDTATNCTAGNCVSCSKTIISYGGPYGDIKQTCQANTTCCFNGSCTVCDTDGGCYTNGCPGGGGGGGGGNCGNGTCGASETCTTCPQDCGACPPAATATPIPTSPPILTATPIPTTPIPTVPPNTCITMYFCDRGSWTCSGTSSQYDSTTRVQCPGTATCNQNLAAWIPNTTGTCYTSSAACNNACNPPPPPSTPIPTSTPAPTATPVPSGDIRVRSVLVPSTTTACSDVTSSTNYIADSVWMNPPGSTKAVSGSGAYTSWLNTSVGSHTFSSDPGASYALKLACWQTDVPAAQGSGYTATLSNGGTLTWNLGYIAGYPWYQANGGDVYAAQTLRSYVPSLAVGGRLFATNGVNGNISIDTAFVQSA